MGNPRVDKRLSTLDNRMSTLDNRIHFSDVFPFRACRTPSSPQQGQFLKKNAYRVIYKEGNKFKMYRVISK